MHFAKSMYLGGKEIHATDPRLSKSSYRELGLRCSYCGEPVFYKKGDWNKPYFSHFPSIESDKYEECLLRQQAVNGGSPPPWWEDNGKQQRLLLFQKHFLYILKSGIPSFDVSNFQVDSNNIHLDDLETHALELIKNNICAIRNYLRIFEGERLSIEINIIVEALDYITKRSSINIFKSLSSHVRKDFFQIDCLTDIEIDPPSLCLLTLQYLSDISWLKILSKITSFKYEYEKNTKKQLFRKIDLNSLIYLEKSILWSANINHCFLYDETPIAEIKVPIMISQDWIVKKKKTPIFYLDSRCFLRLNKIYDKQYESIIECELLPKIKAAILEYVKYNRLIEAISECFEETHSGKRIKSEFYLEHGINSLLKFKEAKIILGNTESRTEVAEIRIDESAYEYQEKFIFNTCVVIKRKDLFEDPENALGSAAVDLLQEVHKLCRTKINR